MWADTVLRTQKNQDCKNNDQQYRKEMVWGAEAAQLLELEERWEKACITPPVAISP